MTDPPSTDKATRPPRQPWQRFTLLDALLLQAGFAVGLSLAGWVPPARAATLPYVSSWFRFIAGGVSGVVLSGPLILAVQFYLRGRRARLSAGEWIWTGAAAIPTVLFAVALLRTWEVQLALVVAYVSGFAYLAILFPFVSLDVIRSRNGPRRPVPCKWTDAFGRGQVLAFGVLSLLLIAFVAMGGLRL